MSSILDKAIQSVLVSKAAWCRFITGNDVGTTGSHQAGFYVPKCASPLLFDTPGVKGENKEKTVRIAWQDAFTTESRMKYYGQGTRNEYRITRFGRSFPFLQDDNVGDLLIITKQTEEDYQGYVLSADEDIDCFFAYFNLSSDESNTLLNKDAVSSGTKIQQWMRDFISQHDAFPETKTMALGAQLCYQKAKGLPDSTYTAKPDDILLGWIDTEYDLFRMMEEKVYARYLDVPFGKVERLVQVSNEILNRRKARAGKALEHHLSALFRHNALVFEEQAVTEEHKKPDFLFPNAACYHDFSFPADDLTVLGAKTTCKDRWRQVLTEADRVEHKYLFTLQQGISKNQLQEMTDAHLTLVVPRAYLTSFPKEYQGQIQDLKGFIETVRNKQEHMPKHYLMA